MRRRWPSCRRAAGRVRAPPCLGKRRAAAGAPFTVQRGVDLAPEVLDGDWVARQNASQEPAQVLCRSVQRVALGGRSEALQCQDGCWVSAESAPVCMKGTTTPMRRWSGAGIPAQAFGPLMASLVSVTARDDSIAACTPAASRVGPEAGRRNVVTRSRRGPGPQWRGLTPSGRFGRAQKRRRGAEGAPLRSMWRKVMRPLLRS